MQKKHIPTSYSVGDWCFFALSIIFQALSSSGDASEDAQIEPKSKKSDHLMLCYGRFRLQAAEPKIFLRDCRVALCIECDLRFVGPFFLIGKASIKICRFLIIFHLTLKSLYDICRYVNSR